VRIDRTLCWRVISFVYSLLGAILIIVLISSSLYLFVEGMLLISSVSIVTGYRLGDQGSIPDGGRRFFLYPLHPASSGSHPASRTMGTRDSFLRVKCGCNVMLTTHPLLVPRLRKSGSYTSSPPRRLHGV
jgi:hypothetical protein